MALSAWSPTRPAACSPLASQTATPATARFSSRWGACSENVLRPIQPEHTKALPLQEGLRAFKQTDGLRHDFNPHRAGGAADALHRRLHRSGVQIGHLLRGDLAHLLLGHLADLVLVGRARTPGGPRGLPQI